MVVYMYIIAPKVESNWAKLALGCKSVNLSWRLYK